MQTIILYGISNCDTVRKAKRWLNEHEIEFEFHDFRKHGLKENTVRQWTKELGWEPLLNRRGTTWRNLSKQQKEIHSVAQAVKLMVELPTVVKRPVLQLSKEIYVGFDESNYQSLF